jgi:hypothetical protein
MAPGHEISLRLVSGGRGERDCSVLKTKKPGTSTREMPGLYFSDRRLLDADLLFQVNVEPCDPLVFHMHFDEHAAEETSFFDRFCQPGVQLADDPFARPVVTRINLRNWNTIAIRCQVQFLCSNPE